MSLLRIPGIQIPTQARGVISGREPLPWEPGVHGGNVGGAGAGSSLTAGLTGFSTSDYYSAAAGQGPDGHATDGSTFAFLFRLDALQGATVSNLGGRFDSNTGWSMYQTAAADNARYDAANDLAATPAAWVAGDVGKTFFEVFVIATGGGSAQAYRQGAASGASDPGTMIAANGTAAMHVGRRQAVGNPVPNVTIVGVAACNNTALSAGQVAAWYASIQSARTIVAPPTGGTHLWTAIDAGATWVDRIGGVSLTRTGAPARVSFVPTWG